MAPQIWVVVDLLTATAHQPRQPLPGDEEHLLPMVKRALRHWPELDLPLHRMATPQWLPSRAMSSMPA
ncbi:hypothetical protein [Deinococcus sp. QL22]|uniref:hypothetical protein n=1 Tax=Deinococcus sp. QL22 TaxID=2939437 RepID=UPI002016FFF9|nr:hypothetical protein [Deinococcus sp. QL22]UQN09460.1 hypothetical protein M1R55_23175 [Deinococcus sp. QL22]